MFIFCYKFSNLISNFYYFEYKNSSVLSKFSNLFLVCWKPGHLKNPEIKSGETKVSIIHKLDYKDCEIWFVRFSMDARQKILALGNQLGV